MRILVQKRPYRVTSRGNSGVGASAVRTRPPEQNDTKLPDELKSPRSLLGNVIPVSLYIEYNAPFRKSVIVNNTKTF
jgi:hypothetical protein